MKQQSIYFLQALWDMDVQKKELEKIAKEASIIELERLLQGVMDEKTLMVSDEAKKKRREIAELRCSINSIKRLNHLLSLSTQCEKLVGEMQALQIKTMQTLNAKSGPLMDDLHIIVKQMIPLTLKKIKQQTYYQMYRFLVLTGRMPEVNYYFPQVDSLETWIGFYKNKLLPIFEQLSIQTLDGRWAYERRPVLLYGKIKIEQFVAVTPENDELTLVIGKPKVGTGKDGYFRIFGRGYFTNISPVDLINNLSLFYESDLKQDFSRIKRENLNPSDFLDEYFSENNYLIAPEKYFEFTNKYIIADTFYDRIQRGNCIYCGSPLYHEKCIKCGN